LALFFFLDMSLSLAGIVAHRGPAGRGL